MAQAKKAASKKSATTARKTATVKPPSVKETLTKSQLTTLLTEHSGVDKKSVTAVLASLEAVMLPRSASRRERLAVTPGPFKIAHGRAGCPSAGSDPFTGEERVRRQAASVKVKMRPPKKLKDAAM